MNADIRKEKNLISLEEEAEVLASIFLPAERAYLASTPQLTPEVVEELLEHFMDPVHGSDSKGRKTVGMCCLHVDGLFVTGTPDFLEKFKSKVKASFKIGHEDVNDLMFTGQRVKWQLDDKTKKKSHIVVEQSLCVSELTEIVIQKGQKDDEKCDKDMHSAYRSLLGSINWLQSRTQFQACYQFSRCASAAASPTVGDCKALNKLCNQIVNDPMELKFCPLEGNPRLMAMPDAAFRNNSDKSSQRAMVLFMSEPRKEKSRNSRGSLIFFESTKIKRTTLSTTVAELYALMKCYGTCQMLRGLIKDITGHSCELHMRTDANNLVTTASTTHVPEQQETIHMIQMLRKEACSGSIADLSHIRTQWCLADCLTKKSANPQALIDAVRQGILKEVDAHPPFRTLVEHKALNELRQYAARRSELDDDFYKHLVINTQTRTFEDVNYVSSIGSKVVIRPLAEAFEISAKKDLQLQRTVVYLDPPSASQDAMDTGDSPPGEIPESKEEAVAADSPSGEMAVAAADVPEDLPSGKRSRTEAKKEDVEMAAPEEEVKEETLQDDPQDAQMPATEEEAPDFGDVDLDDDVSETNSQKMQRANLLLNSEILQRFANSSDEEEGEVRLGPRPRITHPAMATFISQMFSGDRDFLDAVIEADTERRQRRHEEGVLTKRRSQVW